ncbi:TonB-dependent receptor [Flavobacterium selenitireducens]|uniref:TonB-dependent receptor n=1 Tax=Flavobacterium selenitireducens TaxID=2722704 RepID=UPI00168A7C0F|nr:TonB-dependent receptor [Flavobacterium selenitireducens]MBD3582238.1 TonB-dependent receptor [Flavobacterium selenitireducens]
MRIFLALAFLFFGSKSAFAQFTVSGKVTSDKGEILVGCHIHAANVYVNSGKDGSFSLQLPGGKHVISASFIGYKTSQRTISVTSDQTVDFLLETDVASLQEVVVSGNATSLTTQPRQTLKVNAIEKYSNASLGDLVKEISGVSSLKTGNAIVKPVINGLHSNRVLVINNNVRLEDQQWGLEHAPNLDVNAAGSVAVVKGAAGLQFGGDAIGGVIVVDPPKIPVKDTIYGRAILNGATNGQGGSASSSVFKGYKNGWNWKLQGTFKYMGDLETPDYVLSNTGIREKNFSVGFGHKGEHSGFDAFYSYYNAEIGILRASHIGNITDLVNAINNGQPAIIDDYTHNIASPKQAVQHHLAKLNYYRDWHSGRFDVQYSYQFNNRLEYDVRRGDNRDRAALDLDLATHALLADFTSDKTKDFRFKTGIGASYQNNIASIATGVRPLIPDYDKIDLGAYATSAYDVSATWRLEAGLRYDYSRVDATKFYLKSRWEERGYDESFAHFITGDFGTQWKTNPVFTYHNVSASVGSKFQIAEHLNWYVNASLARRNPNPAELFSDGLHHATGQIELGDLRLKQETAVKVATTFSYASGKLAVEVNPYANSIRDFMFLQPKGLEYTTRGAFPVWEYRQTDARLTGVDVTVDWDFHKNFNYHATFAYVHGKDMESGRPLIDMPPANWNNGVSFLKKEWYGFEVGLRSEWAFFQNRYPDNDFYADVIVDGNPVNTLVRISRPPKAYNLLHFSCQITLDSIPGVKTTLAFGIHNLLDTAYRDYLNRMRFYADDIGRNFTLQLKFNF